ncbi:Methyltransferase [Rhynchospora pubera]|uniref:Methyltransferase n=1 Tax=Rhynchospora pubera TaxID=906938 RepID=A0AAV8AJP7_9POAL|nr:Methyltransferase [Rhynchospora pubera]KAJ4753462.1 Methyltransferase [Rhynchospora pubera]
MASSSLYLPSPPCNLKPFNRHSSPSRHSISQHFLAPQQPNTTFRTSLAALPSAKLWDEKMVEETRKKILEKYGNDFSEFIKEPSRKARKPKKGRNQRGKSVEIVEKGQTPTEEEEEEKPPRTTHKLLQVLGGKARRRKLLSPAGMDVRPMMQVVRGAAFGILQAAGGTPASLRPGRWLDLYSGTGSVGIEAISRGCSEAHFVEMDPWVISEVLRPNLITTGFLDVSVIHMKRVESFLDYSEKFPDNDKKFDYVSITPPYMEVDYAKLMDQISRSPLIGEDCFILVEYPTRTTMPETCGHLIQIVDRRFGRTNLLIYGPQWAEKKKRKA